MSSIVSPCLLFASLFISVFSAEWVSFKNDHYLFEKIALESNKAADYCRNLGARLAVPQSDEENSWLANIGRTYGGDAWWLGVEAVYLDSGKPDGSPIRRFEGPKGRLNYTNWAPGEPNNYMPWLGAEDCVSLDTKKSAWNDDRCTTRLWFICQDINECDEYKDLCWSHKCLNTRGSYSCQT